MEYKLDNTQLILITELKGLIKKLQTEGKEYPEIRLACIESADNHWLVTNKFLKDQCIAVALTAYAMTDEQREAQKQLRDISGISFV